MNSDTHSGDDADTLFEQDGTAPPAQASSTQAGGAVPNAGDDRANSFGGRMSVAYYSAEEVISHFCALYSSIDWPAKVAELDISPLRIRRRNNALRELRALSIALWGLALQKSFPGDASDFFARFLETAPFLAGKSRESVRLRERLAVYVDLLAAKKDADFLPVAEHLAEVLALSSEDIRRLRLKISLITRNLYTLIFDRLV